MYYPLKKTQLTTILSMLNNVDIACDSAIFYRDAIYPITIYPEEKFIDNMSDKINGYNLIEDPIILSPYEFNNIYIYESTNPNLTKLREHAKQTGLRSIGIENIEERGNIETISIHIDDDSYPILKSMNHQDYVFNVQLYSSFQDKVDELVDKDIIWNSSRPEDILSIIEGNVVSVGDDGEFVRVSKNTFPFIGIVKLTDSNAFHYDYGFTTCKNGDPCVIFLVSYKKFQAIHILNYIQYDKEV